MDMEQKNWIENILNSTNGITQVSPSDALFSKIQQRIKRPEAVSAKTVWLVAASIAALLLLNISVLNTKSKPATNPASAYSEMAVNNQLY